MRPVRLIGSLALLLALTLPMRAEPPTGEAVITVRTEVRSGPSMAFYPTSTLVPGDRVTIVTAKEIPWLATKAPPPGWLAIRPPNGSFSWVNKRFLTISGNAATVESETSVRVGSSLYNGLPIVEQAKVTRGTPVIIAGKEQTDVDGIWVPITPVPQEVRYIPADAVKPAPPVQTASTTPPPAPVPGHDAAGAAPPPSPATPNDPLWTQAEKAEQEGKRDEARRLYQQLAGQTKNPDVRLACINRIQSLSNPPATMPANPQALRPAASYYSQQTPGVPPIPAPGYPNQPPPASVPPIRPASQYTYTPEIPVPAAAQRPQANYSPGPTQSPQAAAQVRTKPGWLYHSYNTQVFGQPAFFFDMGPDQLMYAVASPGLDLSWYEKRNVKVSLIGSVYYHLGWRKNYIVVTKVIPEQ